MKNIAIIPARSGSKGVVDKNIKLLCGKPLLYYSVKAAIESNLFDEVMVSTDSSVYADIAIRYGANVPFLRSKDTSGDMAGSWDVVKEVLQKYREQEKYFDTVCLLQPTSPLRSSLDIIDGYRLLEEKNANAITSVCEMDHSPLWSMTLDSDLSLSDYRRNVTQKGPRQSLDTYYRINGAIYIRRIAYGDSIFIKDTQEYALVMDRNRSIDIDVDFDFQIASLLIRNQ